jgi:putative flavoprotein involved in K+ transport
VHDLHLRTLRVAGVELVGHVAGVDGTRAGFSDDLGENVAWGLRALPPVLGAPDKLAAERGLPEPELPEPEPFDGRSLESVDLAGFGAVVLAGGFRPDYTAWVHVDGASTAAPGPDSVGVHFLRVRKSSLLCGVAEDAALVGGAVLCPRAHLGPIPVGRGRVGQRGPS